MLTEFRGRPVEGGTFPALIWHDFMVAANTILDDRNDEERKAEGPAAAGADDVDAVDDAGRADDRCRARARRRRARGRPTTRRAGRRPTRRPATTPKTATPPAQTTPQTTTPAQTHRRRTPAPAPTPAPTPARGRRRRRHRTAWLRPAASAGGRRLSRGGRQARRGARSAAARARDVAVARRAEAPGQLDGLGDPDARAGDELGVLPAVLARVDQDRTLEQVGVVELEVDARAPGSACPGRCRGRPRSATPRRARICVDARDRLQRADQDGGADLAVLADGVEQRVDPVGAVDVGLAGRR